MAQARGKSTGSARRIGDMPRAVTAVTALAWLFVAAYIIGTGWQTPSMRETAFARPAAPTIDDELTTGSIVFVPVLGNTCRQNLIDNRTWQVREVGTVPCNEALAASAQRRPGAAPATRFDIIRESFRKSSR